MTKWMMACVWALLITASAMAEDKDNAPPSISQAKSLDGVWTGMLGKMAVTACFGGGRGNYFYQKYLTPIYLYADEASDTDGGAKRWSEAGGNWVITELSENEIHGTWASKDQSRSLPLYLKRIVQKATNQGPESIGEAACGSDEFHKPLEYTRQPEFGPVQEVNKIRYRMVFLSLGKSDQDYLFTGIELLGNDPTSKALNAALREVLPTTDAVFEGMFNIRRTAMAQGVEGGYRYNLEVSILGDLLQLKVHEVVNGYNRPVSVSESTYLFDTRTGKRTTLLAWFEGGGNIKISSHSHLPTKLAEFVYSKVGTGDPRFHLSKEEFDDCYNVASPEYIDYDLRLLSDRMRFEVPVTSSGTCGEIIEIPFAELQPYLNQQGKAALVEIEKSSPRKK